MKEPQPLTDRAQYTLVYRQGKVWANSFLVMKAMPNGLSVSRYGLSVTKRLGKAVHRNRLKRLLREIMRLQLLKPGWDIVLIARSLAIKADYHELRKAVTELLVPAELLESNK